ncbi:Fe-S oxidoreductase, partial [Homoserinimonas aerilata]
LLNPGVLVAPRPLDADLRRPQALPLPKVRGFALDHDGGDFTKAVHRCVGVGKCRADNTASGGFMCPSYLATGDEKDSTRGRARVLQEMANGTLVTGGWQSPEVQESLDLCLSCKACASDCPAGVDMAAYKSEALFRRYEGRMRPVTHYVLGWLPRWARLASPFARILNPLLQWRPLQRLVLWAGGMDARRSVPRFADVSFSRSRRTPRGLRDRALARSSRNQPTQNSRAGLETAALEGGTSTSGLPTTRGLRDRALARSSRNPAPRVLVWADSFSDNFSPSIAHASVAVLEAAGYEVVTPKPVCCGLTWITTGQLTAARAKLSALLDEFTPYVDAGVPILGLEPSCTAVLRSDLLELLPDDPRSARVAAATHTLAELLAAPEPIGPGARWSPPRLDGTDVLVQPHCHQHAVMGFDADTRLLEGLGASVTALAGCCGLAGNFGMEKGHYEVSVAVAENALLPALRTRASETVFLADGFSCRTQADQLGATRGIHLAELLAEAL